MQSPFLAALFALGAATAWGSGDFTGGLASRRVGPFHTVLISYSVGLLALVVVALARLEQLPPSADLIWGALAGLSGMVGLGFLFRGFATGRMGIVAPVSAVLATAIPVIFAALTAGLPGELQLLGFGSAVVGIWLLSRPEPLGGRPAGLGMALLAGLGFGGFFTALGQVGATAVFWPLVAGRLAACGLMAVFALSTRRPVIPPLSPLGLLALAGVLDVGGNLFFLMAIQSGRLDIAAVLGSLYPAVTAILAWLVSREHMARLQVIGVALAVLSIVLITI
ncbi:MAG TPA: DMT family transporter [Anaerolineales bacterium]|jgi:drug/metabolite transporter (DMT)-like permease|nr:DMT family transporter [Anaerolineales bacterium]